MVIGKQDAKVEASDFPSRNDVGIALYEKLGFEMEGTHRCYAFRDGGYVDAYAIARLRWADLLRTPHAQSSRNNSSARQEFIPRNRERAPSTSAGSRQCALGCSGSPPNPATSSSRRAK